MKLFLTLMIAWATILPAYAFEQKQQLDIRPEALEEGNYLGVDNTNAYVHLMLREMRGTKGSFFALLVRSGQNNNKMSLYRVDKLQLGTYVLTPLVVTPDGEIGILNDNPSLVLTVSKNNWGRAIFQVMNSKSNNHLGFQGPLTFDGRVSRSDWVNVQEGNYRQGNSRQYSVNISNFDPVERNTSVVFTNNNDQGIFLLEEIISGMYLLKENAFLKTGMQTRKNPSSIAIFYHDGYSRYIRNSFILINPRNDEDITVFDK
jgi:hypothetical protein